MRQLSMLDQMLNGAGRRLAEWRQPGRAARPCPGGQEEDAPLNPEQKRTSVACMRVNHAGEVAAQGLYWGQALAARDPEVRAHMRAAADEETDHLRWCEQRLRELDSGISKLTPLWAAGSVAIGLAAGLAGDRRSLGFVEETERQVGAHLESHLARLPEKDVRSRAIVARMREDEERHRRQASAAGAMAVPPLVRIGMAAAARVMTRTAAWL